MKTEMTEERESKIGGDLAEILKLRKDREHPNRWQTEWGTKTNLGLYRTVAAIMSEWRGPTQEEAK